MLNTYWRKQEPQDLEKERELEFHLVQESRQGLHRVSARARACVCVCVRLHAWQGVEGRATRLSIFQLIHEDMKNFVL